MYVLRINDILKTSDNFKNKKKNLWSNVFDM